MIKIKFPDGNVKEFESGVTGLDIARGISSKLAKEVLSISVNGEIWDLTRPITADAEIKLFTWDDQEGKHAFWHSSAHLMAEALQQLYPNTKFGIGPAIENGFYYDIDPGEGVVLTDKDLETIEKKMLELARQKEEYCRINVSKQEALEHFNSINETYKVELINDLEDGKITYYRQGSFTDLCRGPHLPDTSYIKAIKLTGLAGAYWRGNEHNKMLTRIYGITFPKQKMLDEWLVLMEEAKQRDHRKIGKEMELFTFSQAVGAGLPMWLPKGAMLRDRLEGFLRKVQKKYGYQQVITPHIGNVNLYKTSGHYQKYGKDSFQVITTPQEGEEFMLKPMNCPHHCEIYKFKPRSYKDLPLRFAEFGTVYRYEQSGELHGLTRVRGFTQDDAHLFCTPDQLKEEFKKVIDIIFTIFKALDFKDFTAQVSLRDPKNTEKYIGTDENWEKAERAIIEAAEEKGLKTTVELGEAAFYGPKVDINAKNVYGKEDTMITIQWDALLAEQFDMYYIDENGDKQRPYIIHRTSMGCYERTLAWLIEKYAGMFPTWLCPEQVRVIPISDKYNDYAAKVEAQLKEANIRCSVDGRSEKIGYKIREARLNRVPYLLIVGAKEEEEQKVSVRSRYLGDEGSKDLGEFIEAIKDEIAKKTIRKIEAEE
mgnify:CR=1 FL=1